MFSKKHAFWQYYGSNCSGLIIQITIREIIQEQNKIKKPLLDQQQLEEIGRILNQSLCREEIHISYYRQGYIHHEMVTVIKIDQYTREVITTDAFRNRSIFTIGEIVDCCLEK
ncbi:YolD-like family protein [Bacillus cereus]|uniref:YolD-like family protein n=1 Tax=Bacillus cereus TaxID=1396 RepID=UPI0011A6D60F|nr:YolD-like family protein [Bacillus cereus]